MRSVILTAVAVLLASCSAHAAEIPSAASGAYVAPDRLCRVVLSRAGSSHIDVDILCVTDAGVPTYSLTRIYAPGGKCLGSFGVTPSFAFSGPDQGAGFVALDQFTGSVLLVRRAPDPTTLANGGGYEEIWVIARQLPSPAPYTCGQQALRFRVFGP